MAAESRGDVGVTLSTLLESAAACNDTGLRLLDRLEQPSWRSWSEVARGGLAAAAALRAADVRQGDRVALILPTSHRFFDAFFGSLLAGAVPVPLYPPVRLGRLQEYQQRTAAMLSAVGARLVLADRATKSILGPTIAAARPALGCRTLDELPPGEAIDPTPLDPEQPALIQFSSGTTRDPKPVTLSHRAVVAQVRLLDGSWPDSEGLKHSGVSWLPLYHDMGLIGCVLPALLRPGTLTLIPPELFVARPALWLRAISRYRATLSPAPSFAYGLCLDRVRDEELADVDLSCWRVAFCGAEPIAAGVLRDFVTRFARFGLRPESLTPVYGLSEASLAVTFSTFEDRFRSRRFDRDSLAARRQAVAHEDGKEVVSVGSPLPGFELRVVDEVGRSLPDRSVGCIHVRGPSLMSGYFGQPEASSKVLRAGWLDTGDLGFLFEGELFLTGRAKDLIILRGRNYEPDEIEQAIVGVPGVRSGCAVAVGYLPEDAEREQLLLLVERRRAISAGNRKALATRCAEAVLVKTGLSIDRVEVLEPGTLPRTSSGKLRRQESLRRYLGGNLVPPAPVNAVRMAAHFVRSQAAWARHKLGRSLDG